MNDQRGLVSLSILFATLFVLFVVIAGAYYTKARLQVPTPPVDMLAPSETQTVTTANEHPNQIIQSSQTADPNASTDTANSSTATPADTSDWQTFATAAYGFTMRYPSNSVTETDKDSSIFVATINAPDMTKTSGNTAVWTSGNTKYCLTIPTNTKGSVVQDNGTVQINGIPFKSVSTESTVSPGHIYDLTMYSTVYNGACYSISTGMNTFNTDSTDVVLQAQVAADTEKIQPLLDAMVHTFVLAPIQHDPTQVADLKKYDDSDFGFSFWMPQNWELRGSDKTTYANGATSERLDIGDVITIEELSIPEGGFATQNDPTSKHGPVSYSYSTTTAQWMVHWQNGDPLTGSTGTTTAIVAFKTVGGLPVYTGSSHFSSMFIPLSSTKILEVSDQGAVDSRYLGVTVVRYGQQLAPSAQLAAEATEAKEFFGGESTYPN